MKESPQKKPKRLNPRLPRRRAGCRHSVAACVSDHSRACERIPLRHRSNLQRKNKNQPPCVPLPRRHAWLAGPPANTCSRGRPAQRIKPPTPNPLVPSTPEPVKAPPKPKKSKPLVQPLPRRHAWLAGPPANTCPRNRPQSKRQQRPPHKTKNPSCRHSVAACVSDHSRGQALPPANLLRTNGNNTPPIVIPDIISRKRKENVRNLRRKAGHPTGVAAALSRSDCTGVAASAEPGGGIILRFCGETARSRDIIAD